MFCYVLLYAVMCCYDLNVKIMPDWCELLSPEKNIGEMQKMHLMQMLQPVITIEVAEVHSAVYVGNPRLSGRTDGGCFCEE